ncbi:MAG TPA: DUF362 domain-containing protein [Candidatus Limiplasma sp.]|nr:DUF362 domain-containing protein [Candidatus Limiplasma sp.]HRX07800.1 DUF362 domain-containing protein [Candidatus Limiplasma sp.]
MKRNTIWSTYGSDLKGMAVAVLEAAQVQNDIPAKDALIGIKPNLVLASDACNGATTHPRIVEGIIEFLRAHGFDNLCMLEGAWVGARTKDAADVCGYTDLAKQTGVPFIDTQPDTATAVSCGGMELKICDSALKLDYLINVPVMKGHCQTRLTCALKNMKGLIPNSEKRRYHTLGLHKPIGHLALGLKQNFVLVDAVCGDLDYEEGGSPVQRDQVFGTYDPVLCDAYACTQLGYSLADVPYIGIAEALGAGSADLSALEEVVLTQPATTMQTPQRRVNRLLSRVTQRDACSACCANTIYALLRLDEAGKLGQLSVPLCVGQGYVGQAEDGAIGIGRCTAAFAKSVPGCPPAAGDILRFLQDELKR